MTQKLTHTVNLTIQEYTSLFHPPKKEKQVDWTQIETKLHNEMDWTQDGAQQVAYLARNYGAFVLRNALALAVSMGIQDGELGY